MTQSDSGALAPPEVRPLDLMGRERQLRSAVSAMDRIAAAFCRASRRSLPYLSRYRARLVPTPVTLLMPSSPGGPSFSIAMAGPDGSHCSAITFDGNAIAVTVDGALGGALLAPSPSSSELTSSQRALLMRIGASLAMDFAAAAKTEVGLELALAPADPSRAQGEAPTACDSLFVVCEIEGLSAPATITLQASAEVLESAARLQFVEPEGVADPRVAEAVLDVPVELVAELGRVSLGLGALLRLRPGDVVRLPTATDDSVRVYAAGVHKLDGVPVVSRGQLAIEVRSRAQD